MNAGPPRTLPGPMKSKAISTVLFLAAAVLFFGLPAAFAQSPAWASADIGRPGVKGSFSQTAAALELSGSGADIWGPADAFHYIYIPWQGDVEVVAKATAVERTDPWAKAGIMLRADLGEFAPHAMLAVTPEKGTTLIRRSRTAGRSEDDAHQAMRIVGPAEKRSYQQRGSGGADTARDSVTTVNLRRWLKLVKRGTAAEAYDSADGQHWEWLGTVNHNLPSSFYLGFAVSSHDNTKLCRAVFEEVSVKQVQETPEDPAPVGNGDGLAARYFPSPNQAGTPITRVDPTIDFDWSNTQPVPGVGPNRFSVRWDGELEAQYSGPHALHIVSDDRARVWLDGTLLIDEWYEHAESTSSGVVYFEAGKRYPIRIDYYQNRGDASIRMLWSSPATPRQPIPRSQMYSTQSTTTAGELEADYQAVLLPRPAQFSDEALMQWMHADVGGIGLEGTAGLSNGVWAISGSGADIWANADGFHYVFQPWKGDGEFITRVISQDNTDPWAKAGLMIREGLARDARHATLAATPQEGVCFLHRVETAGITTLDRGPSKRCPVWLRLVRRGNQVRAFASENGDTWRWIATEQVDLPAEILVGLAVNSHDNSTLAKAQFEKVAFRAAPTEEGRVSKIGRGDGLRAKYFSGDGGIIVQRIDETVDFDWNGSGPAEPIGGDNFSAAWEGWIEPPLDDTYQLHLVSDDGARLWFNGELLVDAWRDQGASKSSATVELKAGNKYPVRLEYYQRTRDAVVKLLWSTPTLPKQVIPREQLYSTLLSAPTPGLEVVGAGQDEGAEETNASEQVPVGQAGAVSSSLSVPGVTGQRVLAEIPGASAMKRIGRWEIEGNTIYAVDRRGGLEFEFTTTAGDIFQVEVEGASHNPLDRDPGFYLLTSVDGEPTGRLLLDGGYQRPGTVQFVTPWLAPGRHRMAVFWDNTRQGRSLQINAIRLQCLDGPDANTNGVKDWVEEKLAWRNGVEVPRSNTPTGTADGMLDPGATISSDISPACLEGRGKFVSMISAEQPGGKVPIHHGAGDRWFGNVELSAGEPTPVQVSFENGGLIEHVEVAWAPTDLLVANDRLLRPGDSLLLTASNGSTGSDSEVQLQIQVNGQVVYAGPRNRGIPHRFEHPGQYEVSATTSSADGRVVTRGIKVSVLDDPTVQSPVAWSGRERVWDWPQLSDGLLIEPDPRIRLVEAGTLEGGGRRFALQVDRGEDRWVCVRLGAGGPILRSGPIHGIDIYGVSESGAFYGEQFEDGSRVVNTAVALSRVLPRVNVRLQIIVGGVMFEDGTLVKTLKEEDFDETGLAPVVFIMPPEIKTSNCHIMVAYEGETCLGEY